MKAFIFLTTLFSIQLRASELEPSNKAVGQLHNYFMANYNQFGGDMKKAYDRYKDLIQSDAPTYSYKGYIHLLYETGNYAHVLQLIPKVDPLFKDTQDIQIIFAKVLEQAGKIQEADARFIQLNDKFKNNQEIAFQAANSYLRRKEPENAIKVIDGLLNSSQRRPNNFIFYFMKAQIQLQLNKKGEALVNVQKSLDLHPRFDKGWLLYAVLTEQEGQLNDAIKGYNTFLELAGSNKEIEEHLLQLLFKQKIEQQSSNKIHLKDKKSFDKALIYFDDKKYNDALAHIDQCLIEKPEADDCKVLKIQILTAMNRTDAITALLKQWITKNPEKQLWYSTLHLLVTQKDLPYSKALDTLHAVESAAPNSTLPVLYLADLYTRAQNYEKALIYLKKSNNISKDTKVRSKILFQIGLNYYESKQYKEMEQVLLESKQLNPGYAPTANLLAYHYATEGKNLNEAMLLIEPVVKKYKNNPHYLDTQALIYLKQNKNNEALALLEKLAQKAPCDYTILVHLSQAQHYSGNAQQALKTIEQAKKYAKTTFEKQECLNLKNQWKTQKA